MNICIVGRFPPPVGGVSVYVSRRYKALVKEDPKVKKIDFSNPFFPVKILFSNSEVYEVNSLNLFVVFIFFISLKSRKCIFIDHNSSRHYFGLKKKILFFLLRGSKGVNVVNPNLIKFYPKNLPLSLISPFVPPDISDYESIKKAYPKEVLNFIQSKPFVVNSAWKIVPYKENQDLYGIITSLELLESLPEMRLLLVIGVYEPEAFTNKVRMMIDKHLRAGRLCLLTGQHQLWPILKETPVFLRLTPTDGDSVSVREALYFSCTTIASDSISRPDGCITYEYGSFESLKSVVKEYL